MTSFDLAPRFLYGDLDLTDYPFMVKQDGIDFSSGDLVTSILSSFLQDGELEMTSRRGNMTLTIPLIIEGTDLLEVAQAQAALAAEADRDVNTLTVDPGDGFAPATVFETFTGQVDFGYSAKLEQAGLREWSLTLRALPFGGSVNEVVSEAVVVGPPPATPVTVSLSDCSTTTGWSSNTGGVVSDGNQVASFSTSGVVPSARLTLPIDLSVTRILVIDWRQSGVIISGPPRAYIAPSGGSAVEMPLIATGASPTGETRTWFMAPADFGTSAAYVNFLATGPAAANDPPGAVGVFQVSRTNVAPGGRTGRQQLRQIAVAGSARTQGSLEIASPSTALGEVLVYTYEDDGSGYVPALRPFKTSPSGATDAPTNISGAYNTLDVPVVYEVPVANLPAGLYAVVARLTKGGGGGDYIANVNTSCVGLMNGQPVGTGYATAREVYLFGSGDYEYVPIATVNLPSAGYRPGTVGKQRVTVWDSYGGAANARVDDVYLVNLTIGRLSMVRCGVGTPSAGGPSSRLWLDTASRDSSTPMISRGVAIDGSDAFFSSTDVQSLGMHEFAPPRMNTFVATSDATDVQVTFRHRPRWIGHAAL